MMESVTTCRFFREFLRDEEGASTILGIFWFILCVGLGGLAVDITDAFRVQTMMQATADASAHEGAPTGAPLQLIGPNDR